MKHPHLSPIEVMNVREIGELLRSLGQYDHISEKEFQEMLLGCRPLELIERGLTWLHCSGDKQPVKDVVRKVLDRNYDVTGKEKRRERARKKAVLKKAETDQ